jgi:CO/xanthine dehydrogenase Mo-binding subunit
MLLALGPMGNGLRAQESGIEVGTRAPAAAVETLDGKPADLARYVGKTPALFEFWATWCPNCKELEPHLKALHAKYGKRVKFLGVAVSVNQSPTLVKRYVQRHGVPWDQVYDRRGHATGAYDVPHVDVEGLAVYTNNPPCGAMRGFGAVQACFAYEAQMDKLAAALSMDPLDLRMRNALKTGSILPTGQPIIGVAPVRECLQRLRSLPLPPEDSPLDRDPMLLPGGAGNVGHGEGLKRGVGVAAGYKNLAYSEGFDDSSEAMVRVWPDRDGQGPMAEVKTAAVEVGQGLDTVVTQIVRTELGIERVTVCQPDTAIGSAGSSSASRQTMMTGGAVQLACQAVREEIREQGGIENLRRPVEATRVFRHRETRKLDANGQGDPHVTFAFGAARAVVEVDQDLGLVRVVQLAVAQDVGRAINPQSVLGQIEGGSAQGLGLALMEEVALVDGQVKNASFTDYLVPTILDMPPVVSELVEEPEPGLPYGAKGVGEPSTVVVPAAVVAALRQATGRDLHRAPVKPDDLVGL